MVEVDANWWGDLADKAFMVEMVRLVRRYMRQPAFARSLPRSFAGWPRPNR